MTDLAVLDSSVALKWVLPEKGRPQALLILDSFEAGRTHLIAPRVFLEEVASALAKRHRRKELTDRQAREAFHFVEQRSPMMADPHKSASDALSLSLRHGTSLWDALYLSLAIDRRCTLLTADARFHRSVSRHYPFIELIA